MATETGSLEFELWQQTSRNTLQYLSDNSELYDAIESLMSEGRSRLLLGIDEFDKIGHNLSYLVLKSPLLFLAACEEGYQKVFESLYTTRKPSLTYQPLFPPHLGVRHWLGLHTVTPRGLSSRLVNRLVCVEGIATRCSLVRPKLYRSVHVGEANGYTVTREHHDTTSLLKDSRLINRGIPKTDKEGNPLKVEPGLCGFKDSQTVTIQEMPESAPTGQLPRSVEVYLEDDLIDAVKPGDRVRVYGVYRAVALKKASKVSGISRAFIIANNVEQLRHEALSPEISPVDIRTIRDVAARHDAFELMSQSIAPSICGHDLVKKGLLLQLLGGERKELENGMKLRGDVHILVIGDPSCGKSQLLRFMMNTAPLALSTTGRGSSGVGLTAAVVTDRDTGERRLDAGAMVLADGGLVCIDEFDKMSAEDRVAIHEVMEQQTVTISKAGIQTSLNARASVLAAANPVYGSFDPSMPLKAQITFPDSLLTRFDLIYIIRDSQTCEADRRICSQVLRQLQHRSAQDFGTSADRQGAHAATDEEWGVIQPAVNKHRKDGEDRHWETSIIPSSTVGRKMRVRKVLSVEFLQKYIYYVKNARPAPVLGEAAMASIANFYADLRQMIASNDSRKTGAQRSDAGRVIPSARTLEACVRLATAHAKLKLKSIVDEEDAKEAQDLILFTLTGQAPAGYHKDGTRLEGSLVSGTDECGQEKENVFSTPAVLSAAGTPTDGSSLTTRKRGRGDNRDADDVRKKKAGHKEVLSVTTDERTIHDAETGEEEQDFQTLLDAAQTSTLPPKRLKLLTKILGEVQSTLTQDSIAPRALLALVNERVSENKPKFLWAEFASGLHRLQMDSKLMVVNEEIWFI